MGAYRKQCKIKRCPFYRAYGYCLKQIGEDCNSYKEKNNDNDGNPGDSQDSNTLDHGNYNDD